MQAIAALLLILASETRAQAESDKVAASTPQPDPAGVTLTLKTHAGARRDACNKASEALNCSRVHTILVKGIVDIETEKLEKNLTPLAVDCIGNDEVKAILTAINGAYADAGFVATQGYLPEQDLRSNKTLVINVIAGRIDTVVYREIRGDEALPVAERFGKAWANVKEASGPWSAVTRISQLLDRFDDPLDDFQILPRHSVTDPKVWASFVTESGEIVQIDLIQQGIDQINRVASSHAQVKLEAGDNPATSKVIIENKQEDSFRINAGYELNGADINGLGNTIPNRFKLDVAKDNLIGMNDAWRLSYAGGLDSNEIRGTFSIPFRRFTFSLDGGYSESLSEVAPGVEIFSGDRNLSGSLGYMLYRARERQINLDATLFWRNSERFLNGVSLSPQTVTHARLGVTVTRIFETMQVTYGVGIDHGLPWMGAKGDPAWITSVTPRSEFWKADGQVSVSKSLSKLGLVRVDVNAQWSDKPLLSDDQLVLGSVSSVRGFTNSAVRADRGIVVRAEFAPTVPVDKIMADRKDDWIFLTEVVAGFQPYLFTDYGIGRDIANRETFERAGLGAGLRYRHGRVNLDASIAEPIYRNGGVKPKNWLTPEAYLTLSIKLL